VVDVGHHDSYSRPLGILPSSARRLTGLPALFVGVRCPLEVIVARRAASVGYVSDDPEPIRRWQDEVHRPGLYDLEVDTSRLSADACATVIATRLREGPPPTALATLGERR
jgi:chloramphenicol 3-O phosphotransferase